MENVNTKSLVIDDKLNKLSNEVYISNSKLNKSKKEIKKLGEINKHILDILCNEDKDLYSAVSEKILEITKIEKEKQEELKLDSDESEEMIKGQNFNSKIANNNEQESNKFSPSSENKYSNNNINKDDENIELFATENHNFNNININNNKNNNEINLYLSNQNLDDNAHKEKKFNLLELFKKEKESKNIPKSNIGFNNILQFQNEQEKNQNQNQNKNLEIAGNENELPQKISEIKQTNKLLIDKIFNRINSQAMNTIGINLIDMDKYEEKLLNHYAGLAHKIDSAEGKSHLAAKEDYLASDWFYVLVFPNPDFDKKEQYCKVEHTSDLYDKFFFPDTTKTSFLKGQTSEKNVFDFVVWNKINDYINSNCLVNKGGCFQKTINNDWKYVSSESFDLKSLIRNVCLYKLTKVLKLDTLCMLSKTGEFVYVLISANEELLKDWAEKTEYELQLEIGEADPLSLEPCDYKFRPLRLSKSATKPEIIFAKEKELEILFAQIYRKELDFLNNLNPYEHAEVPNSQWQAYECFLDFLIANKIQILKTLDSNLEFNGKIVQGIFDLGFEYALKISGIRLRNIWSYFKQQPVGAFSEYFRKDDYNTEDEAYFYWRRYYLSNGSSPTIFKGIDYINLIFRIINSQLKIDELVDREYLVNHFPLHNKSYFKDLINLTNEIERIKFERNNKENKRDLNNDFADPNNQLCSKLFEEPLNINPEILKSKTKSNSNLNKEEEILLKAEKDKKDFMQEEKQQLNSLKCQAAASATDRINGNKKLSINDKNINENNSNKNLNSEEITTPNKIFIQKDTENKIIVSDPKPHKKNIPEVLNILNLKNPKTNNDTNTNPNPNLFLNKNIKRSNSTYKPIPLNPSAAGNSPIIENLEKTITSKAEVVEDFVAIRNSWTFSLLGNFPIVKIKNYFGEKICFYYLFLSLYTKYLFFLSLIGIAVYIVQMADSFESYNIEFYAKEGYLKSNSVIIINTLYSFSVIIWSTFFLENWKKKQITAATLWGQIDFEDKENVMPSFRGKLRRSPLNDNINEIYYSLFKTFVRKIFAYLLSLVIVFAVVTIVVYLLYFRNWLVNNKVWGANNKIIQNVPTILNAIQIFLFNYIYTKVAIRMNKYENHKQYSSFESSLAAKIFIFQFVNSFNSLIIIAYFKRIVPSLGGCVKTLKSEKILHLDNYCDEELSNQMITIALINFLKNFSEIGIPYLKSKLKKTLLKQNLHNEQKQNKDILKTLRESIEMQNNLENFNCGWSDIIFDDFLEIVIQFGFVTLFAISFPLVPLIAWVTNLTEIEVDKFKLLKLYKRPIPYGAKGIGNWMAILELLSYLSVFSNLGLLIFSSNSFYGLETSDKLLLFTGLVVFYCLCKVFIDKLMPDLPRKVKELKLRLDYVADKLKKVYFKKEIKYNKQKKIDFNIYTEI